MSRMRTITETAEYLKQIDPESRITAWTLRTLVKTNQLPCLRIGNRALIDLDTVESYLSNPSEKQNH